MADRKLDDFIYQTVPEKSIEQVPGTRHDVLGVLKDAEGKFVKAAKIARILDWPTRGTQVEIRKAITELIELDGLPIISSSEGFSLTTDPAKLKQYAEQLESRKQGLQRRINKVWELYESLR